MPTSFTEFVLDKGGFLGSGRLQGGSKEVCSINRIFFGFANGNVISLLFGRAASIEKKLV